MIVNNFVYKTGTFLLIVKILLKKMHNVDVVSYIVYSQGWTV